MTKLAHIKLSEPITTLNRKDKDNSFTATDAAKGVAALGGLGALGAGAYHAHDRLSQPSAAEKLEATAMGAAETAVAAVAGKNIGSGGFLAFLDNFNDRVLDDATHNKLYDMLVEESDTKGITTRMSMSSPNKIPTEYLQKLTDNPNLKFIDADAYVHTRKLNEQGMLEEAIGVPESRTSRGRYSLPSLFHEAGRARPGSLDPLRAVPNRLAYGYGPRLGYLGAAGMALSGNETAEAYAPVTAVAGNVPRLVEEARANHLQDKYMRDAMLSRLGDVDASLLRKSRLGSLLGMASHLVSPTIAAAAAYAAPKFRDRYLEDM